MEHKINLLELMQRSEELSLYVVDLPLRLLQTLRRVSLTLFLKTDVVKEGLLLLQSVLTTEIYVRMLNTEQK